MKKYEMLLDDSIEVLGCQVFRIRALIDICRQDVASQKDHLPESFNVKAGDLGGYIAEEDNLSQKGSCWVGPDAVALENARVRESAIVIGRSAIFGSARVSGFALVSGRAKVSGLAEIFGSAVVTDSASVTDSVWMMDRAFAGEHAALKGNALIFEKSAIMGHACVQGDVAISGDIKVFDNASIHGKVSLCGAWTIGGYTRIYNESTALVAYQEFIAKNPDVAEDIGSVVFYTTGSSDNYSQRPRA